MAEIKSIAMPKWGMEMSEGVINQWHVKEGDAINVGDDLLDVETSKIVNTVTAVHAGILRLITAQPGETHAVGATLGIIADASISDDDIQAAAQSNAGSSRLETVAAPEVEPQAIERAAPKVAEITELKAAASATAMSALAAGEDDSLVAASPIARRLAQGYGVNLHNVAATGHHGRISKWDVEAAVSAAGGKVEKPVRKPAKGQRPSVDDATIKATPVARRLAQQAGLSLADCRASGSHGRVCKADVEAAVALAKGTLSKTVDLPVTTPDEPAFESVTMTGMRKTIAARLQESKQTAPHFRVQIDVEIDALLAARKQINASSTQAKISVNDFILKACGGALVNVPEVNVQFDGETIKQFKDADISMAVAIDNGLITPIVNSVNNKGLIAISHETRDLATRAKLNRLQPDEFQGGSFCVSNLGMFGVSQFDAIINPPQAAILAVGAGEQRPVVKDGNLTIATVMTLTLSSDHRVIDGATAARFLAALKGFLERPVTLLG